MAPKGQQQTQNADQPSAADLAAGQEIAGAGAAAAAAAPTGEAQPAAAAAMRDTAQQRGIELSEADANMIATAIVTQMEARGAFEPPPAAPAPLPAAAPAAAAASEPVTPPAPPEKKSFAEKFRR